MKTVAALSLFLLALAAGGSYETLSEREEALFYRSRGSALVGRRLHLHLPPAPFLRPPEKIRPGAAEPCYDQYVHRNVKFIVHPGNPYYQQFRRKGAGDRIVCIKGAVVHFAETHLTAVRIHRIRGIPPAPPRRRESHGTETAGHPPVDWPALRFQGARQPLETCPPCGSSLAPRLGPGVRRPAGGTASPAGR
ncbi:MAG: hypothetical protein JXQ29_05925 [Planctomycetes bacterium]|nr:hypothetical protein [Planctomycetota bacterium]